MKTFLEFISEAEFYQDTLSGSKKSPFSTASERQSKIRRQLDNPKLSDQQKQNLRIRFAKITAGIKKAGTLAKEMGKGPENRDAGRTNTKVRGYASKPRDVVSRVGTTSGVQRSDLPTDGVNVSGRYGDTRSRSQGGGSVPTRNKGQGYSTPERSHYNR